MLRLFQGYNAFKVNPNFPEIEAFQSAEVRAKGFWSDIVCLPDSIL